MNIAKLRIKHTIPSREEATLKGVLGNISKLKVEETWSPDNKFGLSVIHINDHKNVQ